MPHKGSLGDKGRFRKRVSEGRGCLEEGCLGLPGVLPDIFRTAISLGNEGKDSKNLNSQTWPGTPRRPSPRHPRPSEGGFGERTLVPVFVPGEHPNVPSFRLFIPGEHPNVPSFRLFVSGEHPPKPPFWKPPFCQPQKGGLKRWSLSQESQIDP